MKKDTEEFMRNSLRLATDILVFAALIAIIIDIITS